jgi:ABC-type Na+ transport system ATPase subunit NatA
VISCELQPTEGDVYVFGHSVVGDPYAVRRLVGFCRQDDFLWPDLSAKEHLELFAGLRGVDPGEIRETVQTWLESVDLADVQLQYSGSFSGGMKRRLSVALATIGDRPLIILDEPTTGKYRYCTITSSFYGLFDQTVLVSNACIYCDSRFLNPLFPKNHYAYHIIKAWTQ